MRRTVSFLLSVLFLFMPFSVLTVRADTVEFEGISYRGTAFLLPYFYRIENGKAILTDCLVDVSGNALLPETLGGYPLTEIGENAFSDCLSLNSVTLPNTVEEIASNAFDGMQEGILFYAPKNSTTMKAAANIGLRVLPTYPTGDCNADGEKNSEDLSLFSKYLAGWDTSLFAGCADLTEDRALSAKDLLALAKELSGWSKPTVYVVGDSTACHYEDYLNYYPYGGYGDYLQDYFPDLKVVNLAVSGASTKDYYKLPSYPELIGNLRKGDFLFLALGINDMNQANDERYTDPNGDRFTEGSLQYYLYHYYVLPALEIGAEPILCTPTVRRPEDGITFTDSCLRISRDSGEVKGGNYPEAIRALARELSLPLVDLTSLTHELYLSLGSEANADLHRRRTEDVATLDRTHLNAYGAKTVACLIAEEVREKDLGPARYLSQTITRPDGAAWIAEIKQTSTPSRFTFSDQTSTTSHKTLLDASDVVCESGATLVKAELAEGVRVIADSCFQGQSTLSQITLPASLVAIGNAAFYGCSALKDVTFSEGLVHVGSNAFNGCSSLTSVALPDSVLTVREGAFMGCTSLKSVKLSTALDKVSSSLFQNCTSLTEAELGPFVRELEKNAFYLCKNLTSLSLPQDVERFGQNALRQSGLTSLSLPGLLHTVSDNALRECADLTDLSFAGSHEAWEAIEKGVSWYVRSGFSEICCRDGTVSLNGTFTPRSCDVFLIGDSTAQWYKDQASAARGLMGWGRYFSFYFNDYATVTSLALSGRSSRSFTNTLYYPKLLSELGEGDWLFIQFAHNDRPGKTYWTDPNLPLEAVDETCQNEEGVYSYQACLYYYYIQPALEIGATPVLLSPITVRNGNTGLPNDASHTAYVAALQDLAEDLNIPFLHITEKTQALYETAVAAEGPAGSAKYHCFTDETKTKTDNTHLSYLGAYTVAGLVSDSIREKIPALQPYLAQTPLPFDN